LLSGSNGKMANESLGETYFDMGEYRRSQKSLERTVLLLESMGYSPSNKNLPKIKLTRAEVMQGNPDINLERLFKHSDENKYKCNEGRIARHIGEILLNIGEKYLPQVEIWAGKAIRADDKNGIRWNLGMDYAFYFELFKRKGDLSKAKENLNKAIDILKECGATGWVEKYEKELAELSS